VRSKIVISTPSGSEVDGRAEQPQTAGKANDGRVHYVVARIGSAAMATGGLGTTNAMRRKNLSILDILLGASSEGQSC